MRYERNERMKDNVHIYILIKTCILLINGIFDLSCIYILLAYFKWIIDKIINNS